VSTKRKERVLGDEKGSFRLPFPFGRQTILDNLKNGGMGNLKQHAMKQKLWGKVFPFEFDYERHDAEV